MSDSLLARLIRREDLGPREVRSMVGTLVTPETTDVHRAALLVALQTKGETPGEVEGFARELRRLAVPFPGPRRAGAIDLCGSGGARQPSFNVGTVSAFVTRAAGLPVAKHGNRSARGSQLGYAGSSDLLESLGLPYPTSIAFARESFRREAITFLHAPLYHPATRAVNPVRRALGVPTVFNQLGPLTNPAQVAQQVVGAPDRVAAEQVAATLPRLGVQRGLSVSSDEGADEFSPKRPSTVFRWAGTTRGRVRIDPIDFLDPEDRRGSWAALSASAAAEATEHLLAGGGGARRGSVLLTTGAALWVAGRARTLHEGVEGAADALDSGAAQALLDRLRSLARSRKWSEA